MLHFNTCLEKSDYSSRSSSSYGRLTMLTPFKGLIIHSPSYSKLSTFFRLLPSRVLTGVSISLEHSCEKISVNVYLLSSNNPELFITMQIYTYWMTHCQLSMQKLVGIFLIGKFLLKQYHCIYVACTNQYFECDLLLQTTPAGSGCSVRLCQCPDFPFHFLSIIPDFM